MADECIFCKIVKGEAPTVKIYEDQRILAMLDIYPATKGHVIIIPKQHHKSIYDMALDEYSYLFGMIRIISSALLENVKPDGLNILYSLGEQAGQRMPHVYIHLIPRYKEDKVAIGWEPLQMDKETFTELQEKITSTLKAKMGGEPQITSETPVEITSISQDPKKEEPKPEPIPEVPKIIKEDVPSYW